MGGGNPLLRPDRIVQRDARGRTVWITRSRLKIDRIACPWLIRRFVDLGAVFLFVAPSEVAAVAERFDIEGVFWSHRGEGRTFDTMVEEFGLRSDALARLPMIVRGADTARPDLAPQSASGASRFSAFSCLWRDCAIFAAAFHAGGASARGCHGATKLSSRAQRAAGVTSSY